MVKILSVSKNDGVNPRTVRIPRFPSFYSTSIDEDMKAVASKNGWEIVRIIYDEHFFGFGWFDEKTQELID